jgi:hypothetical protein
VLGVQRRLLVDARPVTGTFAPKSEVSPNGSALPTTAGRPAGSMPKISHARSLHDPVSSSNNNDRPAVATSVVNGPHKRCSIHVSVVVMVNSSPTRSRSHATFGATK